MGKSKWGKKPNPRKIDGKKYPWVGWGMNKTNAKERAKELREKGYKSVRIIKNPGSKKQKTSTVYDIYARK